MTAVMTKIWADIGRHRLQSAVVVLVILLSSGASTLALSLLVESDAPFDHAFAAANGAHLSLSFAAGKVTAAQLRATASAHGVTAAAGPWPQVDVALQIPGEPALKGSGKTGGGTPVLLVTVVGRDRPDAPVDRLTIESGRWARAPGEVVLWQVFANKARLGVGDRITVVEAHGTATLLVVGIAGAVGRTVEAWVLPAPAFALTAPHTPRQYQMLYRVHQAATSDQLRAATEAIAAHLPAGAIVNGSTYLDVKLDADRLTAVMIPFLVAFSVFALLAAASIIANIVAGIVIASYREIGVMKAVGFTPSQVIVVLAGQIAVPASAGCLIGIPLGTLGSQPFLQSTAHALDLPAPFTAVIPVDVLVLGIVAAMTALAALLPSWRAARMSAASAIIQGTAPAAGRGSAFGAWLSQLPLPRPLSLGLGDSFLRPARAAMTLGSIVIGVTTIVFALSLDLSLREVAAHLIRDRYVPVNVFARPQLSDRQIMNLLNANPGTARVVAVADDQIVIPGIAEPIDFTAYRSPSSWIGYALISGRWFSGRGEVVAPTKLLTQAHLHVGDYITARLDGQQVRLHLVGEIFDETYDDLLLRGDWSTLAAAHPGIQPQRYEIGLKPGTNAHRYVAQLYAQARDNLDAEEARQSIADTSFLLLEGTVSGLAAILIAIAVSGVFNTVLLSTRERVRDVAILKAVGMAPRQVVAMVVASVVLLGLVAGALGVPIGLELHRRVLELMGQIATGTAIPAGFFDLIGHALLPLLALSGIAVAALGAWIPARWAARAGVAHVLQTE